VRQAPEPGPVQGDRVELYDLFFNAPSPSLRGTEGEVSATLLTVYFGAPSMFITLWFGFDYGTNPPLGTLII
jgi:hypothetical protein